MSAIATFELPKGAEPPLMALHAAWPDDFVSVLVDARGRVTVSLGYWYGQPRQAEQLRAAIQLLLAHLKGQPLYYIRDSDVIDASTVPEYPRSLSPEEVVSSEFAPAMHSGVQYRYLIHDHSV